jgi:release factor glutamine methyltransferase
MTEVLSVGALLDRARQRLRDAPFDPSSREALLLASHVSGLAESAVLAHPEKTLPSAQIETFETLLQRRLDGEPMAYLLGRREFFGREFLVDNRVLIPRPETEHLLEAVLELPLPADPVVLDVGTGTGAIAISLALEIPTIRVIATDCSPAALAVAAANRRRWQVDGRVHLLATDLIDGLDLSAVDVVVSNPPYVAPEEAAMLSREVTGFEPPIALFAPEGGLGIARRLTCDLRRLRPGTWFAMEIGRGQGDTLLRQADASGFETTKVVRDYASIPRVLVLRRRPTD